MEDPKVQVSDIKESLHPYIERVERLIVDYLQSDIELLNATNSMLRQRPGKMLRPMLGLLCAGAAGGINEDSVRFAAASELLHNATLLHDDVVDGATQRRGAPTVSSILNSQSSVLIGDYWLVKCMQVVLSSSAKADRVIRIFAKTLSDLAEGEILQLQKAGDASTTEEDYLRIIYCKTASLFEASALAAAVSAGAPEWMEKALSGYARNLGLAFQIKDDIFDYSAPEAEVGKPVGIDLLEQKITQPLLCALEKATPDEAAAIRLKVRSVMDNPSLAAEVRAFVQDRDGVALAARKQDFYIEKAISHLVTLSDSPEKLYLAELARYVGSRNV
ncbi:MAG: polyprenyl synthetase family protein [Bacteroidales bacterium]|nr:polyprenyl synthetase family protein [Bacteroidales bacterium]